MIIHDVHTNELAEVIAGLVKQGLTFDVYGTSVNVWKVVLTGGY